MIKLAVDRDVTVEHFALGRNGNGFDEGQIGLDTPEKWRYGTQLARM